MATEEHHDAHGRKRRGQAAGSREASRSLAAAAKAVKEEGKANDLLERISCDESFNLTLPELKDLIRADLLCRKSLETG
jgi:hypothetical protein